LIGDCDRRRWLGVDRGHHPKYPLKQVDYGVGLPEIELPEEMKRLLSGDEWKASLAETQQSILELGRSREFL
jgi:hypothetical protein